MNAPHDLDRRLDDWLQDGPNRATERSIAAALEHAHAHPRRRDLVAALRRDPMGSAGFGFGTGLRVMPLVAALGLLVVAALAVATVGGLFERQPAVVPPVSTPSPIATPQPSPSAPIGTPRVVSVDLIGFDGRALSTLEVVDESGTLVDARTGQPADNASIESPDVRNDPADPTIIVLTWNGLLSDEDRQLTIAPDGRTMTLDVLPGCGDLLPVVRELVLTFDGPVPADETTFTVVSEPGPTCE